MAPLFKRESIARTKARGAPEGWRWEGALLLLAQVSSPATCAGGVAAALLTADVPASDVTQHGIAYAPGRAAPDIFIGS